MQRLFTVLQEMKLQAKLHEPATTVQPRSVHLVSASVKAGAVKECIHRFPTLMFASRTAACLYQIPPPNNHSFALAQVFPPSHATSLHN